MSCIGPAGAAAAKDSPACASRTSAAGLAAIERMGEAAPAPTPPFARAGCGERCARTERSAAPASTSRVPSGRAASFFRGAAFGNDFAVFAVFGFDVGFGDFDSDFDTEVGFAFDFAFAFDAGFAFGIALDFAFATALVLELVTGFVFVAGFEAAAAIERVPDFTLPADFLRAFAPALRLRWWGLCLRVLMGARQSEPRCASSGGSG